MTKQVRDWQEDMKLGERADNWEYLPRFEDCGDIEENGDTIATDVGTSHVKDILDSFNALKYWLQQYAAEKERADAWERSYYALQREYAEYVTMHEDDYTLLKAAEAREEKLKELIYDALGCLIIATGQDDEHVKRIVKGFRALYPEEGTK